MNNDKIFKSMQTFYSRLSKIPKQMMIIQSQHMHFEQKLARIIVDRLKYGKKLDNIGNSLKVSHNLKQKTLNKSLVKVKNSH